MKKAMNKKKVIKNMSNDNKVGLIRSIKMEKSVSFREDIFLVCLIFVRNRAMEAWIYRYEGCMQ